MGWYAAKNFCAAHNMSLFNPGLQNYCTADEWSSIQSNHYGSCTAGEKNLDVTDSSSWYGWIAQASSSCVAFYVDLSGASIGKTTQDEANGGGTYPALCVKL
jgi:hypothetical protein